MNSGKGHTCRFRAGGGTQRVMQALSRRFHHHLPAAAAAAEAHFGVQRTDGGECFFYYDVGPRSLLSLPFGCRGLLCRWWQTSEGATSSISQPHPVEYLPSATEGLRVLWPSLILVLSGRLRGVIGLLLTTAMRANNSSSNQLQQQFPSRRR